MEDIFFVFFEPSVFICESLTIGLHGRISSNISSLWHIPLLVLRQFDVCPRLHVLWRTPTERDLIPVATHATFGEIIGCGSSAGPVGIFMCRVMTMKSVSSIAAVCLRRRRPRNNTTCSLIDVIASLTRLAPRCQSNISHRRSGYHATHHRSLLVPNCLLRKLLVRRRRCCR